MSLARQGSLQSLSVLPLKCLSEQSDVFAAMEEGCRAVLQRKSRVSTGTSGRVVCISDSGILGAFWQPA